MVDATSDRVNDNSFLNGEDLRGRSAERKSFGGA